MLKLNVIVIFTLKIQIYFPQKPLPSVFEHHFWLFLLKLTKMAYLVILRPLVIKQPLKKLAYLVSFTKKVSSYIIGVTSYTPIISHILERNIQKSHLFIFNK